MSPFRRLWNVVRRTRMNDDLRQEVETHLALIEEEERTQGFSVEEARHKARSRFGSPLVYRERALDEVVATWIENTWKEIAFATRRLARSPMFTLASVFTLALAIGANASIFAVVQRVVLNPLPYADSDRLITVEHGAPGLNIQSGMGMTSGHYYQYLERARTLEGLALYRTNELTLTGAGDPERIRVSRATPSLASVLRVSPALGRWFTEEEGTPGAPPVAVISHGFWMRRYGGNSGALGQPATLNQTPMTVIGVMPASFMFPDPRVEVWIPAPFTRATASPSTGFDHAGIARLRKGATIEDARAELDALIADLPRTYPNDPFVAGMVSTLKLRSTSTTLKEATVGAVADALWMLLAAVGLVLLVACANVANLFLVRSEDRQQEIAVRRALGVGRMGIARFFFAESALLSMAGGAVGLALAWGSVRLLVAVGPANLPRLQEIRLDGVALAFTFALGVTTALVFGAIPLLHGEPLAVSLHGSGRGNTASRARHRARHLLMGGQIALALVLLVSCGLMVRSFQTLRTVDPGFDAQSGLTFAIGLPLRAYADVGAVAAGHHAILDRVSALPGVTAVSAASCLPLGGVCSDNPLLVEGRPLPDGEIGPIAAFRSVAGGYVEAMGMRLLRGRGIDRDDVERNQPIVVVNQALVDVYFPNQDPIGARVTRQGLKEPVWLTIVGIVSNTPVRALGEVRLTPQVYMPMFSDRDLGPNIDVMRYIVRTVTPPLDVLPSIRRAVSAVDADLALAQVRTLQDILDGASAQMAFTMVLLVIAATVALALGVVGIYGVMSYVVSQRTGEIGVRLALGAAPSSVAGMIVRQGGMVAVVGITVGLAAAFAGSRLIESILYGVSPRDPGVFAATALLLLGIALLACWLPARRAARLSPIEALRTE